MFSKRYAEQPLFMVQLSDTKCIFQHRKRFEVTYRAPLCAEITLSVNVRKGCRSGRRLVRKQPIRLKWFYYIYLMWINFFDFFMETHPLLF